MTTAMKSHSHDDYNPSNYNQIEIKAICDLVCDRIDLLLESLDIEYRNTGDSMITMACPIHGGDNETALNIYHEGDSYRGNWVCRTHGCECIFQPSIIGFIRGVLSRKKKNWVAEGDETCTFYEALTYAKQFVGNKNIDQTELMVASEKSKFTQAINRIVSEKKHENNSNKISRDMVRQSLSIPAEYYIQRNYSAEILDKYDIGLCSNPYREMSDRVVAPIYDDKHQFLLGCTGRSVYNKCESCQSYHDPKMECPVNEKWKYSKWRHSAGLKTQNCLYNMWYAREHIQNSTIAILVESPGNVWRLEENGIHNSVAIFGTSLTDRQKIILDGSGAMQLVLIMDQDDAGIKATRNIIEKCERTYQIHVPQIEAADVGEMSKEQIEQQIKPLLSQLQL